MEGGARSGTGGGCGRRSLGVVFGVLWLSACAQEPPNRSRFLGESFLLAADEAGAIPYDDDYHHRSLDLTVAVLTGDIEPRFGYRAVANPFGAITIEVVHLTAAPAGHRATLELRFRDEPLDHAELEFAREGVAGLRSAPPFEGLTGSQDPLGAVCLLERVPTLAILTRRAADGRSLDAVFPPDAEVRADGIFVSGGATPDQGGINFITFNSPAAGMYQLAVTSQAADRTWMADVRVVGEDELVTLEVQTPTEDGITANTLITVLRTADGCPVLGADLTVEVDGVQTSWPSGWNPSNGSNAVEGTEVRVAWGDLTASAVY